MATWTASESGFGTYQGSISNVIDGSTSNSWQANNKPTVGSYVLLTSSGDVRLTAVSFQAHSQEYGWSGSYLQYSMDGSSWTDIGSLSSSSSAQSFTCDAFCRYVRVYVKTASSSYAGIAEITLTATDYVAVTHTVTVESQGVTFDHEASEEVAEGSSYELAIYGTVTSITDNGTDVSGQLVEKQPESGGTVTSYPTAYSTSGSISGTLYKNCIGKGSSTTATGNDYSSSSSSNATITYDFDFSSIPANATIDSVSVKVGGHLENTSRSTATLQLYSGSTAKGSQGKFTTTSKQVVELSAGTWTRDELQSAKLVFTIGYYGGLVIGVDFVVAYSAAGDGQVYHVYTIASVMGDHLIAINMGETGTALRVKVDGSWQTVKKVYRKTAGTWVEMDAATAFDGRKPVRI